jgi:hypothetical protein
MFVLRLPYRPWRGWLDAFLNEQAEIGRDRHDAMPVSTN